MVVGDAYANSSSGKTFIYTRADKASNFTLQTTLLDGGQNVALSGDGLTLVTGNEAQPSPTRAYKFAGGSWSIVSTLSATPTGTVTAGRMNYFDVNTDGSVIVATQEFTTVDTTPDYIHYFKYNGSDAYVLTDTATYRGGINQTLGPIMGTGTGGGVLDMRRYIRVSSDGKVIATLNHFYDIISDEIKYRHRGFDSTIDAGGGPGLFMSTFGGTGSDQEIFTSQIIQGSSKKIFRIDTNNEKYMMIAYLFQLGDLTFNSNIPSTVGLRGKRLFMKYVSSSGGRDFYKLFMNADGQTSILGADLQTEATFTGDGHLAGKFLSLIHI